MRPYTLVAELTYRCPLACVYCSNPSDFHRHRPELGTAEWIDVITSAEALGVVQLNLSGGEPLLQLDRAAIVALHARGFEVGVETNGTVPAPEGLDWICVSPKAGASVVQQTGDELKLVYPQAEAEAQPERFAAMKFSHYFLQPLDDPHRERHTRAAIDYCLRHPQWRLSLQTHKITGIA